MFPIFIIGCARSGTSIFGEFFEYNSKCQYFYDDDIWDPNFDSNFKKLRSKFIRNTNLSANLTLRKIIQNFSKKTSNTDDIGQRLLATNVLEHHKKKSMNLIAKYPEKHLVIHGPKHSLRIPFLLKIFPNAKFLHIVRDGRDVVCSLKKGMEDNLWVHHKPPGWKKWLNKPVHEKCAWLWNSTIKIINDDKHLIPLENYIQIHYENLIKEPKKVMTTLFNQLGIPFENSQINLCKKIQNEMEHSYHSKVSEKWTVQNHKKRIGRYKENLNSKELEQVNQILENLNSKFNYK